MHFGITEKATTDWESLCRPCLQSFPISSQRKRWKSPLMTTPQSFERSLLRESPVNIRINFILPESKVIWLQFYRWHVRDWLRKTHVFCNRVRNGCSRSSKDVDFGTNRKGVCDFLLVIYSNSWHRFWAAATYWLKTAFFPTPSSFITLSLGMNFWMNFLLPSV